LIDALDKKKGTKCMVYHHNFEIDEVLYSESRYGKIK